MAQGSDGGAGQKPGRFLGSLRDALAAASREDLPLPPADGAETHRTQIAQPHAPAAPPAAEAPPLAVAAPTPPPLPAVQDAPRPAVAAPPPARPAQSAPSAAEAVREARGVNQSEDQHMEFDNPTTRVMRGAAKAPAGGGDGAGAGSGARTQLVRGKAPIKRGQFQQDPVVGWLVIVGGPGLGAYRPIFEGNNTVGRAPSQRVPLDFGDDAISSEEQAYIRYDSADRTFLFVPNLAKTNVVQVNQKKPTSAVALAAMDVIQVGRTQLVFVPFCGADFDWADLTEAKD